MTGNERSVGYNSLLQLATEQANQSVAQSPSVRNSGECLHPPGSDCAENPCDHYLAREDLCGSAYCGRAARSSIVVPPIFRSTAGHDPENEPVLENDADSLANASHSQEYLSTYSTENAQENAHTSSVSRAVPKPVFGTEPHSGARHLQMQPLDALSDDSHSPTPLCESFCSTDDTFDRTKIVARLANDGSELDPPKQMTVQQENSENMSSGVSNVMANDAGNHALKRANKAGSTDNDDTAPPRPLHGVCNILDASSCHFKNIAGASLSSLPFIASDSLHSQQTVSCCRIRAPSRGEDGTDILQGDSMICETSDIEISGHVEPWHNRDTALGASAGADSGLLRQSDFTGRDQTLEINVNKTNGSELSLERSTRKGSDDSDTRACSICGKCFCSCARKVRYPSKNQNLRAERAARDVEECGVRLCGPHVGEGARFANASPDTSSFVDKRITESGQGLISQAELMEKSRSSEGEPTANKTVTREYHPDAGVTLARGKLLSAIRLSDGHPSRVGYRAVQQRSTTREQRPSSACEVSKGCTTLIDLAESDDDDDLTIVNSTRKQPHRFHGMAPVGYNFFRSQLRPVYLPRFDDDDNVIDVDAAQTVDSTMAHATSGTEVWNLPRLSDTSNRGAKMNRRHPAPRAVLRCNATNNMVVASEHFSSSSRRQKGCSDTSEDEEENSIVLVYRFSQGGGTWVPQSSESFQNEKLRASSPRMATAESSSQQITDHVFPRRNVDAVLSTRKNLVCYKPQPFAFVGKTDLNLFSPFAAAAEAMDGISAEDVCAVCGGGGSLHSCCRCPCSFHLRCLVTRRKLTTERFSICPACRSVESPGPPVLSARVAPSVSSVLRHLAQEARQGNPVDYVLHPALYISHLYSSQQDWIHCVNCRLPRTVHPGVVAECVAYPFRCSDAFWLSCSSRRC